MGLPSVITPGLLSAIRSTPRLPSNTWYLLAATALSTLNRPDEIPKVFNHAIEHGGGAKDTKPSKDEQLQIARRTREALVKSSAIIGLPKTINALFSLKAATPQQLFDEPLGYSPSNRAIDIYTTPPSQILQRGQKFFDAVYQKVSNRVMGQMDRSGTEDLGMDRLFWLVCFLTHACSRPFGKARIRLRIESCGDSECSRDIVW
jgi:hypothetical protein